MVSADGAPGRCLWGTQDSVYGSSLNPGEEAARSGSKNRPRGHQSTPTPINQAGLPGSRGPWRQYDRALQSVCLCVAFFFFFLVVFMGLLGRGPEKVHPSWGGQGRRVHFSVCSYLYFLVALLAKQAGFPCPGPRLPLPAPCVPSTVCTQAGKPWSLWALTTRQPSLNLA